MPLTWIIDTFMEDRNDFMVSTPLMAEVIRDCGLPIVEERYIPFSESTQVVLDDPNANAIAYGSIGFVRQIREKYPNLRPGGFFETPEFSAQACMDKYTSLMLNWNTKITEFPLSSMDSLLPALVLQHGPVFVRPNGVGKAFTGTVVGTERYSVKDFLGYVNAYSGNRNSISTPDENETVRVHRPVEIEGEYRFVCGPDGIIASSQYRYGVRLGKRIDIHPKAKDFAEWFTMPGLLTYPDRVYVMDVAIVDGIPYIVEFNNFSNSGLYMCDRLSVVRKITEIVQE